MLSKGYHARDQIIIGTTYDEIRRHALKNQWNLSDLIQNGRQLEAAMRGANRIKSGEVTSANVNRTKRNGKYSKKWKPKGKREFVGNKQQNKSSTYKSKSMCSTCSSEFCKGGKRCPRSKVQFFDCQNMVISVVWPFVKGRRIRNLYAELTVTMKHYQKMKSLNMIHQTHLQIQIIPNSQGM